MLTSSLILFQVTLFVNIPKVFEDYHDLLALDEIEAVHVCTFNQAHRAPTVDALRRQICTGRKTDGRHPRRRYRDGAYGPAPIVPEGVLLTNVIIDGIMASAQQSGREVAVAIPDLD